MPTPSAFKLTSPIITITKADATTLDLKCFAKKVAVNFELNTDGATFCEPDGTPDWYIEIDVVQSFGVDGAWNNLSPLANQILDFAFTPDSTVTGGTVDNPTITGKARIPRMPFLDAEIKQVSNLTLRLEREGANWQSDEGAGPRDI